MFKAIALSLALLYIPAQAFAASPNPTSATAKAKKTKKTKKAKHAHAEEAWVCNTFYGDAATGHACTFKSGKGGKCGWCGVELVKAGSKEDLERQAKAPKK